MHLNAPGSGNCAGHCRNSSKILKSIYHDRSFSIGANVQWCIGLLHAGQRDQARANAGAGERGTPADKEPRGNFVLSPVLWEYSAAYPAVQGSTETKF